MSVWIPDARLEMPELLVPGGQPRGPVKIDWSHPLARKISYYLPLNGSPFELAKGQARLTYGAGGSMAADARGMSLRGNGSAACASIPMDLSASSSLTVSFWMYWDAFVNDDDMALELTSNPNTSEGSISINPNDSSGTFSVYTRITATSTGKYARLARPSAAEWHHYFIGIDRSTASDVSGVWVYIDGVKQTPTYEITLGPGGAFANSTLYLFSRNNASLFGAGRMQNLIFRLGNTENAAEIISEYRNPYQFLIPQ